MKAKNKEESIYLKIMIGYLIPTLLMAIICYPLLPRLLNYPPNSINNQFQLKVVPTYYWVYYVIVVFLGMLLEYLFLNHKLKIIKKIEKSNNEIDNEKRKEFCEKVYNLANSISIEILILPIVALSLVFFALRVDFLLSVKIILVIFIMITVSLSVAYIYAKRKLKLLIEKIYNTEKPEKLSSIKTSTYIQLIPFTIASVIVIGLVVLSQFSYNYGNSLFNINKNNLITETKQISNSEELNQFIKNKFEDEEKDSVFFYVNNGDEIVFSNGMKSSKMFKEYLKEYAQTNGGRVYDNYGIEAQGVMVYTPYSNEIKAVGYRFNVIDSKIYFLFLVLIVFIVTLNYILLKFYSTTLVGEINGITEKLTMLNKEGDITGIIPITSNDELGSLQDEYNSLQNMTQGYIDEIEEKRDIIVKQQQLVSIGELAGGVAHDINTPISAIKTGITMLNTMSEDRTDSEKEILDRMDNCATKIIKIVNSMRNQIRNLGGNTNVVFKISDVINDVKTLTYHEVMKNKSEVVVDIVDDVEIKGDPTKLGQVMTNLIVNAAQAYDENGGKINVMVSKVAKKFALINIIDYAGGMNEEIVPYVFKNILTTKGTSGTGIGLYLAYSVIKGEFNGEIDFNTQKGEGTTFSIRIPLYIEE